MRTRLRRLKRERDLIEREIQEMPESPLKAGKRELLRKLDELIQRLEGDENAIRSVVDEEYKKALREQAGRARRDALVAIVTALAALVGYSVNVPAAATEDELQHVANVLNALFAQQMVQALLEHMPPTTVADGVLHPWLSPLPLSDASFGSVADWRNGSRRSGPINRS